MGESTENAENYPVFSSRPVELPTPTRSKVRTNHIGKAMAAVFRSFKRRSFIYGTSLTYYIL